jgi:hypothetical protein
VTIPPVAFYCVCDSRYFLGAVAMLNSLRLAGHTEPVYVLDCGLTDSQRDLLRTEATLVPASRRALPWLLKTVAPLRHPAEVMALIDTDAIVIRPLTEVIERVVGGGVAAFRASYDRFFPEWGELLGLGPVRRQPYLCSALVLFGGELGGHALSLLDEAQRRIPTPDGAAAFDDGAPGSHRRSSRRRAGPGSSAARREFFENAPTAPFVTLDQDALNAVLSSHQVDAGRVIALEHRLAPEPPFPELALIDTDTLHCAYSDGIEPYALHHLGPKPWIAPMRENLYSRLLVRLLAGRDTALRVPTSVLPLRLREGPLGGAGRTVAGVQDRLRSSVGEPLSWRIGSRLDAWAATAKRGRDRSAKGP